MVCPVCSIQLPIEKMLGKLEITCNSCKSLIILTVEIRKKQLPKKRETYDLIVNLRKSQVFYKGHSIPTVPPNNLMPQQLGALYILAKNAGRSLTPEEIWKQMEQEGWFDHLVKKPSTQGLAPEAKHLRFGILNVFKFHLNGHHGQTPIKVKSLIETISNPKPSRLRLNLSPQKVRCIGLK